MINSVVVTGKVIHIEVTGQCVLGIIECNDEQFYILFNFKNLPEPKKLKNKYVNVAGILQHFKRKDIKNDDEYTIELGIFVRRLEVYDI